MTQPCAKDCAGRSPTCHTECEKYKAFARQQQEDYVKRLREYEVGSAIWDACGRMRKHKPRQ